MSHVVDIAMNGEGKYFESMPLDGDSETNTHYQQHSSTIQNEEADLFSGLISDHLIVDKGDADVKQRSTFEGWSFPSTSGCVKVPIVIEIEPELFEEGECIKEFSCFYCHRVWNTLLALRKHVKTKHSSLYRGLAAGTRSKDRPHFIDIRNRRKSNQEKSFLCPHCEHRSARKHDLLKHVMSKHTGERPFQCALCEYRTARKHDLDQHSLSKHTGERPFQCPHCQYKCARKNNLKKHIISKHTSLRPFQCPHCEYSSARKNDLKRHLRLKHRDPYSVQIESFPVSSL